MVSSMVTLGISWTMANAAVITVPVMLLTTILLLFSAFANRYADAEV